MGAHPGDPGIVAHIESVSSRAESDTDRLVSAIFRGCWPGGIGDRTEAVAREWVRRWGPRRAAPSRLRAAVPWGIAASVTDLCV